MFPNNIYNIKTIKNHKNLTIPQLCTSEYLSSALGLKVNKKNLKSVSHKYNQNQNVL